MHEKQELEARINKAKHSTHISEEQECLMEKRSVSLSKQACKDPIYYKDQRTKHKQTEIRNN